MSTADHDPRTQQVIEAELRRVKAVLDRDVAAMERLLTDDLTYTHALGRTNDKGTELRGLTSSTRFVTYERRDLKVRFYDDVAVMTGGCYVEILPTNVSEPLKIDCSVTQVWIRRGGDWQMAAWAASGQHP